jgi:cysteine desulfuration protein SufE
VFERLGLENHITMNRRNGFYSMVERIRLLAESAAAAA